MVSPGASSPLAKPLIGNYAYNATYLCRFCCIGGDHDCAAAPRDAPRCACKLSGALRLLDRNRGRLVVSLTCRVAHSGSLTRGDVAKGSGPCFKAGPEAPSRKPEKGRTRLQAKNDRPCRPTASVATPHDGPDADRCRPGGRPRALRLARSVAACRRPSPRRRTRPCRQCPATR
jgi:hypothetical protein